MEKVYKINYLKAPGTYGTIFLFILPFYLMYLSIKAHQLVQDIPSLLMAFFMCGIFELIGFYLLNIKVIVKDDGIYIKKMDKTEFVAWDNIRKVERLLAIGSYRFIIRKKKGRFMEFPDYLDGYEEVLAEIKKRTGIEVKWGL